MPSAKAVRRIRERLTAEMRSLRGASAIMVIRKINPIVRGSPGVPGLSRAVA
jgi:RNA-directed DNA polymerase